MFEADFLSSRAVAQDAWAQGIGDAVAMLRRSMPDTPYSGATPQDLREMLSPDPCPEDGMPLSQALLRVEAVVRHSVVVGHPAVAAHLHCPPLIPALAAEVVLSALNQSMDSFDQAPAATILEQRLTDWLCRLAGLPSTAGGTFTSGGTQSNALGLWLARDAHLGSRGWSVRERGLPPDSNRMVVLCSEVAHFTVEKSAIQLGLGTDAVVKVPVDSGFAMDPVGLRATLDALRRDGRVPIAIVATAGTTDHGAIDPLHAIADAAKAHGAWLHVDAAYGGALLFSTNRAHALDGIERADSVGLDLHKLLWQPISSGAFLLREAAHYDLITTHADYLNPESHLADGVPDLVNRSLLTTRRFDALKLWVTVQTLGRQRLGAMIDATCDLAVQVGRAVAAHPWLELVHAPEHLSCVLFRYRSEACAHEHQLQHSDRLQAQIRDTLFGTGSAVIGITRVNHRTCLKLTVLNPVSSLADMTAVLEAVATCGRAIDQPSAALVSAHA